jgi:hypothetical protein
MRMMDKSQPMKDWCADYVNSIIIMDLWKLEYVPQSQRELIL